MAIERQTVGRGSVFAHEAKGVGAALNCCLTENFWIGASLFAYLTPSHLAKISIKLVGPGGQARQIEIGSYTVIIKSL